MKLIEPYNLIDLCIAGTIFVTLILGLWKGFVKTLTSLAGLVVGVVSAVKYHLVVSPYLGKISSLDPQISVILSMMVVFVLVQIFFIIVRRVLDKLLDLTRLTWLDRVLGGAMGATAGFLIVATIVQVMLLGMPEWPLIKTSNLIAPVERLTEKAINSAPQPAREQWTSFISKWKGTSEVTPQTPGRHSVSSTPMNPTAPGQAK